MFSGLRLTGKTMEVQAYDLLFGYYQLKYGI